MTLTLNTLADKIEAADEIIQAWHESPDPNLMTEFRGRRIAVVSDAIYAALDELFEITLTDDVADDAKSVVLAIDAVAEEHLQWLEAYTADPELTSPAGNRELWARWGEVVESLKVAQTPLPKPESVKALQLSKVSFEQIAMIYGWQDAHGQWEVWKVREELDTPGKHFNPETWVHPTAKRRMKIISDLWRKRSRKAEEKPASSFSRIAPESIEDLIRQQVSSAQICRMKQCSIEEVKAVAARIGVPLDGQFLQPVRSVDPHLNMLADEADKLAAAQAAMQEQPKPIGDRLEELAARGETPERIVEILQYENPKMSPKQIEKLIKGALANTGV